MSEKNPLFIVGCPRSGTTVVRLMLASHSSLGIPPEGTFICDLYPEFGAIEHVSEPILSAFLDQFYAIRKCQEWLLPRTKLRAHIQQRHPGGYADLVDAVYDYYLIRTDPGKRRWGDKNPIYVMHLPLLQRLFPQAKFIHVIRDGRDVALSHRHPAFAMHAVDHAAQFWKDRVMQGHNDGKRLGEKRYLELRYEDLCLHPEPTLQTLCDFCDVPLEYPRMMQFYQVNAAKTLVPAHRLAWHSHTLCPLDSDRIGVWKRAMTRQEILTFQGIAGDVLGKFGYDLYSAPPSLC